MSMTLLGHFQLKLSDKVTEYECSIYECDECGSIRLDSYSCPICRQFAEHYRLIENITKQVLR